MKIIAEGKTAVRKILGKQKQKSGICRKMRYVLETRGEEGLLLLNTVTGELVRTDEAEAAAWEALPGELSETLTELYGMHFLVPEGYQERKTVDQIRAVLRLTSPPKEFTSYTILPTMACNARCFYCYESGYPLHTMTEETAEAAARLIIKNCAGKRRAKLHWFGGEPLVGKNRIAQICKILKDENIEFTSDMTTNGYLFTPELVGEAKEEWKLSSVQITLDGTEEIYNRTKAYVDTDGSPYRRVLDNIGDLLDAGIRVNIRMNLDRHNEDDLAKLVDELAERFSGKEGISCYTHELFDSQGFEPIEHSEEDLGALARRRNELTSYITSAGLSRKLDKRPLPSLSMNFCMADSPKSLLINPLGKLGKCEHVPFDPPVGDVQHGITAPEVLKKWLSSTFSDACADCELYPYCAHMNNCPTKDPCQKERREGELSRFRRVMLETHEGTPEDDEESCFQEDC